MAATNLSIVLGIMDSIWNARLIAFLTFIIAWTLLNSAIIYWNRPVRIVGLHLTVTSLTRISAT